MVSVHGGIRIVRLLGAHHMIYALIAVLIAQAVYTYVVAGGSHE